MTPLGWLRHGARNLPSPPPPVLPVDDREEIAARAVTRWLSVDRAEPTCPPQLANPQQPAPAYKPGSRFGMCDFSNHETGTN